MQMAYYRYHHCSVALGSRFIELEGRFGLSSDSNSVHFCFWHTFGRTWYNNKLGDSGTHDLNQRRICLQCGGVWGTQRYLCCWIGRLPNPTPVEFCMPNINTWRSIDWFFGTWKRALLAKVPVFMCQKMALRAPGFKNRFQKPCETPPKMVG